MTRNKPKVAWDGRRPSATLGGRNAALFAALVLTALVVWSALVAPQPALAAIARRAPLEKDGLPMRVLLLGISRRDNNVASARRMLMAHAVPFDIMLATEPGTEFPDLEDAAGNGKYGAIVFSNTELAMQNAGTGAWTSTLTAAQLSAVHAYQEKTGVRMVVMEAGPTEGLVVSALSPGGSRTASTSIALAQPLAHALALDGGLVPDLTVEMEGSWHTPVQIDERLSSIWNGTLRVQPLMYFEDAGVRAGIAATISTRRTLSGATVERLDMFMAHRPGSLYSALLAPVWIRWMTRGAYVGARRIMYTQHQDDHFLRTELWVPEDASNANGPSVRLSADDLEAFANWQVRMSAPGGPLPAGSALKATIGVNGQGVGDYLDGNMSSLLTDDPLYAATQRLASHFSWVTHTWSHPVLDDMTYNQVRTELERNKEFLGVLFADTPDAYDRRGMITPSISGLFNGDALRAMWDSGVRVVVGDNSRTELTEPRLTEYTGWNTTVDRNGFAGMYVVGREALWVFYDVATPEELWAEYKELVPSAPEANVQEFFEADGQKVATQLLELRHDPYMYHQANMISSGSATGDSLMSMHGAHVLRALARYNTLPVQSGTMTQLLQDFSGREELDTCGFEGRRVVRQGVLVAISVRARRDCVVPVTGARLVVPPAASNASTSLVSNVAIEEYGSETTSWVALKGSSSFTTLPLQGYVSNGDAGWRALDLIVTPQTTDARTGAPVLLTLSSPAAGASSTALVVSAHLLELAGTDAAAVSTVHNATDGTTALSFSVQQAGVYTLVISVDGHSVGNTPLEIQVRASTPDDDVVVVEPPVIIIDEPVIDDAPVPAPEPASNYTGGARTGADALQLSPNWVAVGDLAHLHSFANAPCRIRGTLERTVRVDARDETADCFGFDTNGTTTDSNATLAARGDEYPLLGAYQLIDVPANASVSSLVVSAWSAAQSAERSLSSKVGQGYALYADMELDNGAVEWGRRADFARGTHDWAPAAIHYTSPRDRTVRAVHLFTMFEGHSGSAIFSDFQVLVPQGGSPAALDEPLVVF